MYGGDTITRKDASGKTVLEDMVCHTPFKRKVDYLFADNGKDSMHDWL